MNSISAENLLILDDYQKSDNSICSIPFEVAANQSIRLSAVANIFSGLSVLNSQQLFSIFIAHKKHQGTAKFAITARYATNLLENGTLQSVNCHHTQGYGCPCRFNSSVATFYQRSNDCSAHRLLNAVQHRFYVQQMRLPIARMSPAPKSVTTEMLQWRPQNTFRSLFWKAIN